VYDIPLIDLQPQFDNPVAEAEIVKQIGGACKTADFLRFVDTVFQKKLSNIAGRSVMIFFHLLKQKS
jgi:isopenicillin N synthase-like dioxygenase